MCKSDLDPITTAHGLALAAVDGNAVELVKGVVVMLEQYHELKRLRAKIEEESRKKMDETLPSFLKKQAD